MAEGYKTRLRGENNPRFSNADYRVCQHCGNEYRSYNKTRKYCSHKCAGLVTNTSEKGKRAAEKAKEYYKNRVKQPKASKEWVCTCVACGVEFVWQNNKKKYCVDCTPNRKGIIRKRYNKLCVVCGEEFLSRLKNQGITCSDECAKAHRSLRQLGPRSHRWKGGKTKETALLRKTLAYATWRTAVFSRDNYTCQLCGGRGGKLAAHHIKPFSKFPHLVYIIDNGITLCWECHGKIHWKEEKFEQRFIEIVKGKIA